MTNVIETHRKPDFDNGKIGAETQSLKIRKNWSRNPIVKNTDTIPIDDAADGCEKLIQTPNEALGVIFSMQ